MRSFAAQLLFLGSFSLASPHWLPQATNAVGTGGVLVFTNTPDATTNKFWRIRSAVRPALTDFQSLPTQAFPSGGLSARE
jgi:hypothetical protein